MMLPSPSLKDPQFWGGGGRGTCSGWFAFERGMTIQMTLRLMRAALVEKAHGRTAVWPRATWILPGLSDTSRDTVTPAEKGTIWSCACPFLTAGSTTAPHHTQSGAVNTLRECSNQRMTHRSWSQNKKGFTPLHLRR